MNIKNSRKKFAIIAIFTFVIHSSSPFLNTADISISTAIPVNATCTRSYFAINADLLIKSLFHILTSCPDPQLILIPTPIQSLPTVLAKIKVALNVFVPKMWRYNLIWDKINRSTGFLNANRCPLRIHEDIVVFYKSQPTYNPQFTLGQVNHKRGGAGNGIMKASTSGGEVSGAKNRCYGNFAVTETRITNEKYPTSIIRVDKEHDGNYHHPTQKPVNLIRWLVRTYTNEGDLVLDNCMGSGTTAVACIKEKRHFIGYEITKEYFDIAQERIKQEQSQLTLF